MVVETDISRYQVKIGGIACSFCANTIRKALMGMDGIKRVSVSLSHEEALVEYDPALIHPGEINEVLINLGYTVRDPSKLRSFEEEEFELKKERKRLILAGVVVGISIPMMISMWIGLMRWWFPYLMFSLAVLNVFGPGWYILKMAYHSLKRGIFNQHVLMELTAFGGLAGGLLGSVFPEFPQADFFAVTIFVTAYHILSGYTSMLVRARSSKAVKMLLSLQPALARVVSDGNERMVSVENLKRGDVVRVKPGETIPVDGMVVQGESSVDESIVSGESIPVEKNPGDEVISGSINLTGSLLIEVTSAGEESFIFRVARYVEEARALKPGILQLVDRILKYYIPFVIFFSVLAFTVWTLGLWIVTGGIDLKRAVYASLSVFIMGYPCALGMSTPLAVMRGGGEAASKGILMRSGEAFQAFREVRKVVLDKTGTLTEGEPEVTEVRVFNGNERYLLAIAGALERNSEHPVARAILREAERRGISIREISNFKSTAGSGVEGILDGKKVMAGSVRWIKENGIGNGELLSETGEMEAKGQTVVVVAVDGELIGAIGVSDRLREDAVYAIREIKKLGLQPVMVTGDNERTARAVAEKLGIEEVIANVLPEQKAEQIRKFQEKGHRVAMVGDGINDAPALMQADVGIAIGTGADIAIESADVIIMNNRITAFVDAFNIAMSSYKKTVQNLAIAFTFNGLGVPLSVTGLVHPVYAMMAMVGSVSLILLNSFAGKILRNK